MSWTWSAGTANWAIGGVSIKPAAASTAPTIANLSGDTLAYTVGGAATVIEQGANAAVSDIDSADFNTGALTVSFAAGGVSTQDVLAIRNQGTGAGQIGVSGANVTYAGTTIGTWTGGTGGSNLVITLNANSNATNTAALIQNITYQNTETSVPTTGARTVRFVLSDGDGDTSANYDTSVNVTSSTLAVVTTVSNAMDGDTSSIAALNANKGADGFISLREAITAANNTAGADTIRFNIAGAGVQTIAPTVALPLPTITGQVTIDGYTQSGASVNTLSSGDNAVLLIELAGTGAGSVSGLTLGAGSDGSTIKGLVINRFALNGIQVSSTSNLIAGNFLGTNSAGTTDLGNTGDGVTLSANNNTIGGSTPADRNLISGNNDEGVDIDPSISGNVIVGNYIGTDRHRHGGRLAMERAAAQAA